MERSIEMMVALVGITKAGAPTCRSTPLIPKIALPSWWKIPHARAAHPKAPVASLPPHQAQVVRVDADWDLIAEQSDENVFSGVRPTIWLTSFTLLAPPANPKA